MLPVLQLPELPVKKNTKNAQAIIILVLQEFPLEVVKESRFYGKDRQLPDSIALLCCTTLLEVKL